MLILSLTAPVLGLLALNVEAVVPITKNYGGINTSTGVRPSRLEINAFAASAGPGWDLYIQCFASMQAKDQSKVDSFYQIAGIHGRPYLPWDGVPAASGSHGGGYCPHNSVLFPTWHRPYLQLFEQTIWTCAQSLAATYPKSSRSSYVAAAKSLRVPYWDWVKVATLPPVTTTTTINVNTPSGKQTITNPLYQYNFHSVPSTSDFPANSAPYARSAHTLRSPDSNGQTNLADVNSALTSNAGYLHDTSYLILTRDSNYAEFSNNAYAGTVTGYGSIENPHGTVHNCVGGNKGHMTYLDYSAFDPIFWLHHANVDRLIAIWQALHPDSFTIDQEDDAGTYSIAAGTTETDQTPLGPFHKDSSGTMWTSNPARGTRAFGYTYPEVQPWGKTAAQNTAFTRAAIRNLYDPSDALARRDVTNATAPLDPSAVITNGVYHQWALNVRVNKFAIAKSFSFYAFVGAPSATPADWATDPNLVGTYPVLRPATAVNDNLTIFGALPLTRAMLAAVDAGQLDGLEVAQATSFLKKNLTWRIMDTTGAEIPVSEVSSLVVYVVDQVVTPPASATDFPTYGKQTPHRDITAGKAGGIQDGQSF